MKIITKPIKDMRRISSVDSTKIILTKHAIQRINERYPMAHYRRADMQKVAAKAKTLGVPLKGLNEDNCEKYGISKELYWEIHNWLLVPKKPSKEKIQKEKMVASYTNNGLSSVRRNYSTTYKGSFTGKAVDWYRELGEFPLRDNVYIYGGYFWFFTGKGKNYLRTVIEYLRPDERG